MPPGASRFLPLLAVGCRLALAALGPELPPVAARCLPLPPVECWLTLATLGPETPLVAFRGLLLPSVASRRLSVGPGCLGPRIAFHCLVLPKVCINCVGVVSLPEKTELNMLCRRLRAPSNSKRIAKQMKTLRSGTGKLRL